MSCVRKGRGHQPTGKTAQVVQDKAFGLRCGGTPPAQYAWGGHEPPGEGGWQLEGQKESEAWV